MIHTLTLPVLYNSNMCPVISNLQMISIKQIGPLAKCPSEVFNVVPCLKLCTDASACRGMLLRHGAGKVKHLSVKQLWSQEVLLKFAVQVDRVSRANNPADLLTHSVSFPVAVSQLRRLSVSRESRGEQEPTQAPS